MAEDIIQKDKRKRGRPEVCPFSDEYSERQCYNRALSFKGLYYHPGEPGSKKDFKFVYSPEYGKKIQYTIGKTTIWSMVYYYYVHDKKLILDNLEWWIVHLQLTVGLECVGDRTSIQKNVAKYKSLDIHRKRSESVIDNNEIYKNYKKLHDFYKIVVHMWETAPDTLPTADSAEKVTNNK